MSKKIHIPDIRLMAVADLKEDADNPNEMSDAEISALKIAIQEDGFLIPIIVMKDGTIADGHQRLRAARELGMEQVPVIIHTGDELKRLELQQYMNKLRGRHDEAKDAEAFRKLYEAGRLDRLASLLATKENRLVALMEKYAEPKVKGDVDKIPLVKSTDIQQGEAFVLGDHVIVCGDSTEESTWKLFPDTDPAEAVFTDPPYGVSYSGDNNPNGKDWGVMENDDLRGDELQTFLTKVYKHCHEHSAKTAAMYTCYAATNHMMFEQALIDAGWRVKQHIVWDKGHILGRSDYHWAHEPILYCAKQGENCVWWGDRTQKTVFKLAERNYEGLKKEELISLLQQIVRDSTVWEIKRDNVQAYQHATQKPVALATKAIRNSTRPGAVVLEPFSGSGSTLIACETTGRKCRAIEYEPLHVATAIKRWESLTGRKAKKLTLAKTTTPT